MAGVSNRYTLNFLSVRQQHSEDLTALPDQHQGRQCIELNAVPVEHGQHHQSQAPGHVQHPQHWDHFIPVSRTDHAQIRRTTPIIWLVVWSVACSGFLVGYTSGPNIAAAPAFRDLFLPQMDPTSSLSVSMGVHGSQTATCHQTVSRITWFLAPKYIAGFIAALPVGWVTRVAGRRVALWIGCATFVVAHMLRGLTSNLVLLMLGQAIDGISSAFLYQAPFLEAVEIAPRTWRGAFGYADQIGRSVGLFSRSLLQQGLAMQPGSPPWGWRLAVLFPVWPALVVMMLVPHIPETPNSLMQRGQLAAARAALQQIRGPLVNVEQEFQSILDAAGISSGQGQSPLSQFKTLIQVHQLPPLILLMMMAVIREFSGADFALLYSQPLQLGLGIEDSSHGFAMRQVANSGYCAGAIAGCVLVDTWGRRPTFLLSSLGSCCFYTLLSVLLITADRQSGGTLPAATAAWVQISIVLAYASYAVAWAVGFYVVMAELFPLATRSLAMSLAMGLSFCMFGVSSGTSLSLACDVRFGAFILFAAVNALGAVLVYLLFPETKQVPLEDVGLTFNRPQHWLWKHFSPATTSAAGMTSGASTSHSAIGAGSLLQPGSVNIHAKRFAQF